MTRLDNRRKGGRRYLFRPPLTEAQIEEWASAHFRRTGEWPGQRAGAIPEAPGTTWAGVDLALRYGHRGLPGGSSLAKLLPGLRQVQTRNRRPLRIKQILAWADAHHERTGEWPTKYSGRIDEAPDETWQGVNHALRCGTRGQRGGLSLAELLQEHRGVRRCRIAPDLDVEQILGWAKAHFRRTGHWPSEVSGEIPGSGGETWKGIDFALRVGRRGLPGGSSVAKLLAERGRKVHLHAQRELTSARILRWADAHHEETGEWPSSHSGKVRHVRGETWERVDGALRHGLRGLPGGSSLAQLLAARRGVRNPASPPRLTEEQILAWADAHHARTGRWPRIRSGVIAEAPEETWKRIHEALRQGSRGLPGGSSLARLLAEHRGVPNDKALPRWTVKQILAWAGAHHARTGAWPTERSGPIPEVPGETWDKVDGALRNGYRGLLGGSSLYRLLQDHQRGR